MGPTHIRRAICFIQSTDSNIHLSWEHSHPRNRPMRNTSDKYLCPVAQSDTNNQSSEARESSSPASSFILSTALRKYLRVPRWQHSLRCCPVSGGGSLFKYSSVGISQVSWSQRIPKMPPVRTPGNSLDIPKGHRELFLLPKVNLCIKYIERDDMS